jgi:hypothetical protein
LQAAGSEPVLGEKLPCLAHGSDIIFWYDERMQKHSNMSLLSTDTHPAIEDLQFQGWRQASPTQKMTMLAQLNASARRLALAGLRARYPHAGDSELRLKLAGFLFGEELARKAYQEADHAK